MTAANLGHHAKKNQTITEISLKALQFLNTLCTSVTQSLLRFQELVIQLSVSSSIYHKLLNGLTCCVKCAKLWLEVE